MKIAVNKAHFPVTVLGPGRRIGLWLQGCSIRCKGCVSRDTWEPDPAKAMTVASLLAWCRRTTGGVLDGVTISGGEPFDQPAALAALLDGLQRWRRELARPFDLLCYSGHPLKTLQRDHGDILARLDALIPEPYSQGRPLGGLWRGSDNQPLLPLSPLGEERYREAVAAPAAGQDKRMQVAIEAGRLWFIGIPHRGDMAALETLCRARGLDIRSASWR